MLGSLLGSLASCVTLSATPDGANVRSSSSASAHPDSPAAPLSPEDFRKCTPPAPAAPAADIEDDPFQCSAYFQRLLKRGGHHANRIQAIKEAALSDNPPREPGPWECCGGGCALECVVTMWWEEEKTWRDMHPGWKSIKQRLKEEEEDRQREAEEEAALSGLGGNSDPSAESGTDGISQSNGEPSVKIGVENAELVGSGVTTIGRAIEDLAV